MSATLGARATKLPRPQSPSYNDRVPRVASTSARIPALDGLRAVAIVLVVFSHEAGNHVRISAWATNFGWNLGPLGVDLFFVISGFIITTLLLEERDVRGRISLGRFYMRRAVRLWPTLWLFLLTVAGLTLAGELAVPHLDLVWPALFLTDYMVPFSGGTLPIFHTWSLSIEEQFYLVWPPLIILMARRNLAKPLIFAFILAPFVRVAAYELIPQWRAVSIYQFHIRYDFLVAGCLLALDYRNGWRVTSRLARHGRVVLPACVLVAFGVEAVISAPNTSEWFLFTVGYTLQALALGGLVGMCVQSGRDGRLGRLLDRRLLVHLGAISYGLYLWQEIFIMTPFGPFKHRAPLALLAALVCAELSWWLVDKPLARLRRRLHSGQSKPEPSIPQLAVTEGIA
jgi:peptidoglycan/LPS O-acetylase OafA/YrhL